MNTLENRAAAVVGLCNPTMNTLGIWRLAAQRQMAADLADIEEDDELIESIIFNGPFAPQNFQSSYVEPPTPADFAKQLNINKDRGFPGMFGSLDCGNNDLNVLDRSPLLNQWLQNESARVTFEVNGVEYKKACLLVDGIYPSWSIFISTVHLPQTEKLKKIARCQEGAGKDVERAFGVLQGRFHIVKHPARSWYQSRLVNILYCCVVLHNMIVEDE
ncbi:unnamed protein product [Calypogeia fissa]